MSAKSTVRPAPHAPDGAQHATAGPAMSELAAVCMGLPWLKLWSDAWELWSGQLQALSAPPAAGAGDERRAPAVPWVPQLDATVIPFRRRDDQPGLEATRWSLRLHVPAPPWLGGSGNVIAIDTVVPRTRKPEAGR